MDVDSLMDEVLVYLAVVELFRAEGCEPGWRADANFGERESDAAARSVRHARQKRKA